eukprot:m51a1_g2566 hypothetical protein (110) ;mRNA; r:350310-351251
MTAYRNDPRSKWVIERLSGNQVCVKNVGTGKYLMVPDKGINARGDCDGDRAAWELKYSIVLDSRGLAWTLRSIHRNRFLSAQGDNLDWVSADRKVDAGWEHFVISTIST